MQLLLAVCERGAALGTACQPCVLPSITHVLNLADSHDRAAFAMASRVKQEPRDSTDSRDEVRSISVIIRHTGFCGVINSYSRFYFIE